MAGQAHGCLHVDAAGPQRVRVGAAEGVKVERSELSRAGLDHAQRPRARFGVGDGLLRSVDRRAVPLLGLGLPLSCLDSRASSMLYSGPRPASPMAVAIRVASATARTSPSCSLQ